LSAVRDLVMRNIARAYLPALVVLALLIAGCGTGSDLGSSSTTHTDSSAPSSGGAVHVFMKILEFSPASVEARVGQRVVWTNEDTSPHNVRYVSGPRFASSRPKINLGGTFSITLTQAGTIHYFCSLHPWMKATIVVSP
jgi:plastocyanin